MAELTKPNVLLVDDDEDLLAGTVRTLRTEPLNLVTATNGMAALQLLQTGGPFAVIVSDLRMPGMDGIDLLGQARTISPETVRVLFTGELDIDTAIAAVNRGSIFRFIVKPCLRTVMAVTLRHSIDQHNLITAQRVLLEQTLHGSIKMLTDILAMANPLAFGQATRLRQGVRELVAAREIPNGWQVEIAAMLSRIGWVILPPAVLEKVHERAPLSEEEDAMVQRIPTVVDTIVANIPRLEPVREILRYQSKCFNGSGPPRDEVLGDRIPWGARALKLLSDADQLEPDGIELPRTIEILRGRKGWYDPELLETWAAIRRARPNSEPRELPLAMLHSGMTFAQDVRTKSGILFIARGQEVTPGLIETFRNFGSTFLDAETVRVQLPAMPDPSDIADPK